VWGLRDRRVERLVEKRRPQTLTSGHAWRYRAEKVNMHVDGLQLERYGDRIMKMPHAPRPSARASAWRASAICRSRPTGAGPSV